MLGRRQFMKGLVVSLSAASGTPPLLHSSSAAYAFHPMSVNVKRLSPQMLEDVLVGSSYLGCGGGGSLKEAQRLIREELARGSPFATLDVQYLEDDDLVASPYSLSSLAPPTPEMKEKLEKAGAEAITPTLASFDLLASHMGKSFSAVVLGEIGPLSVAEGLIIAARLILPTLDADTVGRATPEINQHSVRVAGYPLTPAAAATPFGDEILLTYLKDPNREELIFRTLSTISSEVGVTDAPISGRVAKSPNCLVKNSLSLAMSIGKAVRLGQEEGTDPIEAARQTADGYSLFEGSIETWDWADKDGFLIGTLTLKGHGRNKGDTLLLDYKNEHLVARKNGEVIATCPDLISVIDKETSLGINNPEFVKGQAVTVLGFKCNPLWRRPEGLAVFEPRYFGYDIDYVPIETRLEQG